MKRLNIALVGCGVVGGGFYAQFERERGRIARATGVDPVIIGVAVRNARAQRSIDVPQHLLTTDAASLVDDAGTHVVVELIGGDAHARGILSRALVNGRNVITANKLAVARRLPQLRRLEDLHGGRLLYGAAVCGSVPILKVIDETLATDRIRRVRGIVNGTTNFVLSRLAEGVSREEAMHTARDRGFIEADPSADLSGADAAHKLSILAFHAFGRHVAPEFIPTTGMKAVTDADLAHARAHGRVIRLVAEASLVGDRIDARVAPRAVTTEDPLAHVHDEMNIVELQCENVGTQYFTGRGAGSLPTANAVLSDLLDVIAGRRYRRAEENHACFVSETSQDCRRSPAPGIPHPSSPLRVTS